MCENGETSCFSKDGLRLSCAFIFFSKSTGAKPVPVGSTGYPCLLFAGTQEFPVSLQLTRAVGMWCHCARSESVHAHSSWAGRASSGQLAKCMGLTGRKRLAHLPGMGFVFPVQSRSLGVFPPLLPQQHHSCVCHLSGSTSTKCRH